MQFTGLRALVVDDNEINRNILRHNLSRWGFDVSLAAGGNEATQVFHSARAASAPFHVVLLDAHMPEVDGFAVAAELKGCGDDAPVLMMLTSDDLDSTSRKCRELGVGAHLVKPVAQYDLLRAIERLLSSNSAPSLPALVAAVGTTTEAGALMGQCARVLVAEDNAVNRKLLTAILDKRGFRVTLAADGREALERFGEQRFDIVLLDVQMPELSGFEVVEEIRRREAGLPFRTPVVALTAHAMAGDRDRCLKAGMDDYVSKPVQRQNLLDTINRLVAPTEITRN